MLSVSLDCSFMIAPSVFSNVYFIYCWTCSRHEYAWYIHRSALCKRHSFSQSWVIFNMPHINSTFLLFCTIHRSYLHNLWDICIISELIRKLIYANIIFWLDMIYLQIYMCYNRHVALPYINQSNVTKCVTAFLLWNNVICLPLIIAFVITLLTRLYVRICILLTSRKHLHDRIGPRGNAWANKTS